MTRAGLYIRVSKVDQTVENQRLALERYCQARGYEIISVFSDGKTDHTADEMSRNGFNQMIHSARRRDFDILVIWSVDRLSRRGILPVLNILTQLKGYGVGWDSLQEPWATSSGSVGEVLISILAWSAKVERERLSERIKAGLARRKNLGHHVGRKPGSKDRTPRSRRWRRRPGPGLDTGTPL